MKVSGRIGVSVLIILFLAVGLSYGQSAGLQSLTKGVDYGAQGKFEEAKKEFEKIPEVDRFYEPAKRVLKVIEDVTDKKIERKTAIHLFKAIAHAIKRQWGQAIPEYTQAIETNPRYAYAYVARGSVYLRKGQHDKAFSDFTKAIEINPRYAFAYFKRANAYYSKGQYDRAISDYTKTIELNPGDAEAYAKRGVAYDYKGQYDQAISDYTKAIELNPRYAGAYHNRGTAYIKFDQSDHACDDFQKACDLGDCDGLRWAENNGYCR